VADFYCSSCQSEYELKSKKDTFLKQIVDGAFDSMISRINSQNNPNFFFLNYSMNQLVVKNFIVIPKHYFVNDIIEKRKALSPNAKRAGWVGCNILLHNIPESGKIFLVRDGNIQDKRSVLQNWSKTSFLAKQNIETRGWIIEIMKILDRISQKSFTLKDVYMYLTELQIKFPHNNFIKDKIRQQLQVLRDKGLLEFNGKGNYTKV
jgi:type II restriction enzyme